MKFENKKELMIALFEHKILYSDDKVIKLNNNTNDNFIIDHENFSDISFKKAIDYEWSKTKPIEDKQLCWFWGGDCFRELAFYNKNHSRVGEYKAFNYDGGREYKGSFQNCEPFEGEYPEWAKEALLKLED